MSKALSLTPEQRVWVEEEIKMRKKYQAIPGDDDSQMLAETHKEVIRALNKLDQGTVGKTKDDFDVLVNIMHRSMIKSLLKVNQEKWRTAKIMDASQIINYLEKKADRNVKDNFTIKINKNFINILQDLKLGSKALGDNKEGFEKAMKQCFTKAADTDIS